MLKLIATTILCILINPLWAQEVSNVQVQQNGEELKVMFDLSGPKEKFDIQIEIAEDGKDFRFLGRIESLPGKTEFRKQLKEHVFYAAGVFRVSVNKLNIITDIDGNKYKTIKIGDQYWMKENLKTSKYRNGDAIATNLLGIDWQNTTIGAYAIYENDAYGKLYNWYVVADPRGLCPTGWHVPTDAEWYRLENFLDPFVNDPNERGPRGIDAGAKLKAVSSLWTSPNRGASNSSGFSALPGGSFNGKDGGTFFGEDGGAYYSIGRNGYWWSSKEDGYSLALLFSLDYNSANSILYPNNKKEGFSVRCLKD